MCNSIPINVWYSKASKISFILFEKPFEMPDCKQANIILTNDIIAANNKILTSRSSNCSKTSCQMDFPVKQARETHYSTTK